MSFWTAKFTNLIRYTDKDSQKEDKALPVVFSLNLLWCQGDKVVCHVCQEGYSDSKIVSISLHKVMPCDGSRVYMMFSERTNKGLPKNKKSTGLVHKNRLNDS